jgi:site-specific recombinase XerD
VNKHGVHILRHTFCSRLAMNNAPMKAIQELAGHADLSTTMRYMHLSPASRDGAIRLQERGDSREAAILAPASS